MATTICDICNGVVAEDDLRGHLKVGTASMAEGRKFDVKASRLASFLYSCLFGQSRPLTCADLVKLYASPRRRFASEPIPATDPARCQAPSISTGLSVARNLHRRYQASAIPWVTMTPTLRPCKVTRDGRRR